MRRRKHQNTEKQNRCIQEGFEAAKAGKPLDTGDAQNDGCPYRFDLTARSAWLVGWEQGGGNPKTGKVDFQGLWWRKTHPPNTVDWQYKGAGRTIFYATNLADHQEAVVIADDESEAKLLLPGYINDWKLKVVGTALPDEASDVLSLVSSEIANKGDQS
jgi:ribosome modulation factor